MKLWEIIIEVGSGTPVLEKYFYIVSCQENKRARRLAMEIHLEKYPEHTDKNPGIVEVFELELVNSNVGVWFNKREVYK